MEYKVIVTIGNGDILKLLVKADKVTTGDKRIVFWKRISSEDTIDKIVADFPVKTTVVVATEFVSDVRL